MKFVDNQYKNDREVVLTAIIRNNGLEYASKYLINNHKILYTVLKHYYDAIDMIDEQLIDTVRGNTILMLNIIEDKIQINTIDSNVVFETNINENPNMTIGKIKKNIYKTENNKIFIPLLITILYDGWSLSDNFRISEIAKSEPSRPATATAARTVTAATTESVPRFQIL